MRVVLNFNPHDTHWTKNPDKPVLAANDAPNLTTDKRLFLGFSARLEINSEYAIPMKDTVYCLKCGSEIDVSSVITGSGILQAAKASLICDCSVWEGEASPFSGRFSATDAFRRVRDITPKERAEIKLGELDEDTKMAIKEILHA